MKNLSSQAHAGTIPHSPPSGKINLFAYKIFILYSSVIHSCKSKTFKPYSVWREGKRDWIFHIQVWPWQFFSIGSSFRKGFFFQVLRIFFFLTGLWPKRLKFFRKSLWDHTTQICSWLISILPDRFHLLDWEKATPFL